MTKKKNHTKKKELFEHKSALVMGIGLHGGGVATAKWLVRNGATVTATDMRTKNQLLPSLGKLRGLPIRYVLGEHRDEDFVTHDLIVANPAVRKDSPYLAIAHKKKKRIENDTSLFFRHTTSSVIAVTGTRGKTTTALWIASLLKKHDRRVRPSGNTPENALLREFDRVEGKGIPVVAELSSWQCEFLPQAPKAPHIAVITNIYPDHLNRYKDIRDYASAKANIFIKQKRRDVRIFDKDTKWFEFFAKKRSPSHLLATSMKPLPSRYEGLFIRDNNVVFRHYGKEKELFSILEFALRFGEHNVRNLLLAVLAVLVFDPGLRITERDILRLRSPRMRQEIILDTERVRVVNDSCATSPDGTVAAIRRFGGNDVTYICGGTDKSLEFKDLAREIVMSLHPEQLILLEGTATLKLCSELSLLGFAYKRPKQSLEECVDTALKQSLRLARKQTIVFSPGAASFEKFLHEFDRGEQFSKLAKEILG